MATNELLEFSTALNPVVLQFGEYRLRCGDGYWGSRSTPDGVIVERKIHANGRLMYRIEFRLPAHQSMFGNTYFYADDLEVVE